MNSQLFTSERLTQNLKLCKSKSQARMGLKLSSLVVCQANFMQVLLQKIDRRSRPIKKQERHINANLKRKRIYLEKENFDIIGVLKQAIKSQDRAAAPQLRPAPPRPAKSPPSPTARSRPPRHWPRANSPTPSNKSSPLEKRYAHFFLTPSFVLTPLLGTGHGPRPT